MPAGERTAVFDNDGTLWCEKPMPVQLDFLVRRFAEMAAADESLRSRQPYKAAHEGDLHWLGAAMVKHYQGDDADMKLLMGAVAASTEAMDVEEYERRVAAFFTEAKHPKFGRLYTECAFVPMIELLRYLEANGFTTLIASGGDRDFMRPVAETVYDISRERVIGSSMGLAYEHGSLTYKPAMDFFDDGPEKPVRIWSRIGRRPTIACGNSNGDLPMLRYAMAGAGPGAGAGGAPRRRRARVRRPGRRRGGPRRGVHRDQHPARLGPRLRGLEHSASARPIHPRGRMCDRPG